MTPDIEGVALAGPDNSFRPIVPGTYETNGELARFREPGCTDLRVVPLSWVLALYWHDGPYYHKARLHLE